MSGTWFWIALAGSGALHGLNPASGWFFAAIGPGQRWQALRSLLPIALGHIAALGLSAASVAYGTMPERNLLQGATCLLLLLAAAMHLRPGPCSKMRIPIGCAGLALWPLAVPGMHGASLMLPLSMPLCGDTAASGTLAHAAAAILIHTAAMLLSAGTAAYLACHGKRLVRNLCAGARNPIPLPRKKTRADPHHQVNRNASGSLLERPHPP